MSDSEIVRTPDEDLRHYLEQALFSLNELDSRRPREFRTNPDAVVSIHVAACRAAIGQALKNARELR